MNHDLAIFIELPGVLRLKRHGIVSPSDVDRSEASVKNHAERKTEAIEELSSRFSTVYMAIERRLVSSLKLS